MKIDGNEIKKEILLSIKNRIVRAVQKNPILHIFVIGENEATNSFVKAKEKTAEKIGVDFVIHKFEETITENELIKKINELQNVDTKIDGIIIQLPLPIHINTDNILNSVLPNLDIDVLSDFSRKNEYKTENFFKSPIQKTLTKILENENYDKVAIVGNGKLIGRAAIEFFKNLNKEIFIFEKGDDLENLKKCNLIISGTGVPNLINKDMINKDCILIDFGYGNLNGKIVGDINENCFSLAKKYTTVPGGTGPIMVAYMFENLIESFERNLL